MVYIASWQEYQEAAEGLYERSPDNTRYCVKWSGASNKLVLKITDNTTCLKFKTYSSIFLNRFEALNLSLMEKMQNRRRHQKPVVLSIDRPSTKNEEAKPAPATSGSSVVPAQAGGPAAGGVKKKKPKKKR